MTRRGIALLIPLALAVFVGLLAAGPPPAEKRLRLGYVLPGSPGAYTTSLRGLRQGLHERGYVEGQHVVIEERYAEGQMARLPELFAELIRLKADLLVAPGTVIAQAARQATTTIPIVAVMGDPVGTGLAESLGSE
jgi:putative ABC transport system substrate-binding protein